MFYLKDIIKYRVTIIDPFKEKFFYKIDFEPPYEYMSLMFEGNESSGEVSEIITGIGKVKQKRSKLLNVISKWFFG